MSTDQQSRLYPAEAAVALIISRGHDIIKTPVECKSSIEQAGYDAYHNGFLSVDAIYLGDRYQHDNTITEWLAGYWLAHKEGE